MDSPNKWYVTSDLCSLLWSMMTFCDAYTIIIYENYKAYYILRWIYEFEFSIKVLHCYPALNQKKETHFTHYHILFLKSGWILQYRKWRPVCIWILLFIIEIEKFSFKQGMSGLRGYFLFLLSIIKMSSYFRLIFYLEKFKLKIVKDVDRKSIFFF